MDTSKQLKERGLRLTELRQNAGLTRDQLSAKAKIGSPTVRNSATIGNAERGGKLRVDTMLQVTQALADELGHPREVVLLYWIYGTKLPKRRF